MRRFPWVSLLQWLLAAFFIFGSAGNIFASAAILEDYHRWGYPDWFHYVTGASELSTGVLLLIRSTRTLGAAIGCAVMLAAALTVVIHGEYLHALAPIVVLAFSALALRLMWVRTKREQVQPR